MSDDQTPAEEFNDVADAAVDEIIALKAEVQALKAKYRESNAPGRTPDPLEGLTLDDVYHKRTLSV